MTNSSFIEHIIHQTLNFSKLSKLRTLIVNHSINILDQKLHGFIFFLKQKYKLEKRIMKIGAWLLPKTSSFVKVHNTIFF